MACRIISSSFIVTPILVLIISCHDRTAASSSLGAAGGQLVRHTCRRAARSNPSLNFDFCVASLDADPRSSSADLRGLGIIVTDLAEANATATQKRIGDLLAEHSNSSDTGERHRLEDCRDMYSDAFQDLKDAEAGFYSKRYRNANLFLGGALDYAVDCEDSWQESSSSSYPGHKYSSPLTSENYNMEQLCRIGLAITAFLSPHFMTLVV